MERGKALDASIIKDLSNHIYEKRKATAYQIETLTRAALERNDSQEVYNIVNELGELTNGPTNSARMGAITALGSVSVALGPFAIAYYLEDIITPIFSTFKDTDARVRYYACESLYNIAKVARGEILLYFNEVFDVLCVLVTDSESSVKNAADILDRLIKDIVSAKATNYVSILHQQNELKEGDDNNIESHIVDENGNAIQVNKIQDTQKAFSLPKFIPTLLERMYIIDPFAKKFLISWLELLDDIPSLELITFLPNFLEPLINFLKNNAPSDIRIETQNLLNTFLKEVKAIQKVKDEVKRRQLIRERKRDAISEKETPAESKTRMDDGLVNKMKEAKLEDKANNTDAFVESELSKMNSLELDESIASEEQVESHDDDQLDDSIIQKGNENQEEDKEGEQDEDEEDIEEEEEEEEFLEGQNIFIDYLKIIAILLSFMKSENPSQQQDYSSDSYEITSEVKHMVLKWLLELIQFTPISFTKFFPECVTTTIQNIASSDNDKNFELRNALLKFNLALQSFFVKLSDEAKKELGDVESEDRSSEIMLNVLEVDENTILGLNKEVYEEFIEFQLSKCLQNIMRECLTCANELARITLLDWLIFLYSREPSNFVDVGEDGNTFDLTALLQSATDSSNEVILKVLQLLSKISETNQDFFKDFMVKLIMFFQKEIQDSSIESPNMSSTKGTGFSTLTRGKVEFIIRKLCVTLDSEKIFKTISEVLSSLEDVDLEFLNMIVVTLNNILLTTPELTSFRKKLKNLDAYKVEDWSLFSALFESWSHNSASALSLCLLTANYDLAFLLIKSLAELEITYQILAQLDILVQLLESPIFLKLRLQLLEPEKNPYLYKTLYGLLMILPQSSTYTTLHNRLSSISSVNNLNSNFAATQIGTPISTPVSNPSGTSSVSQQLSIKRKRVYEMLEKFNRVQESHEGHQLNRKLRESATSSLYQNDDASFHRKKAIEVSSQSKSDRLLSYSSSQDRKDYFNIDSVADNKQGPRMTNKLGLGRFNGS